MFEDTVNIERLPLWKPYAGRVNFYPVSTSQGSNQIIINRRPRAEEGFEGGHGVVQKC